MNKKPAVKKATGKPMGYAKGGMTFKPCAGCPNAAKCKAMGKCMKKAKSPLRGFKLSYVRRTGVVGWCQGYQRRDKNW